MDTAHLMFCAAAATPSMDSWDLENLKYLRKISRTNNNQMMVASSNNRIEEDLEQSYSETASYLSSAPNSLPTIPHLQQCSNSGDEIMRQIFEPRFKETLEVPTCASVHNSISQSDNQFDPYSLDESSLIEGPEPPQFCLDNEIKLENGRFLEEPNSLLPRPLDTCCEFEILTIRNESVLASKREALVDPQDVNNEDEHETKFDDEEKSINSGKSGSNNFSTIEDFLEEGNSVRKVHEEELLSQTKNKKGRSVSDSSSCPSSSSSSGSSIHSFQSTMIENERRAICPFCDGVGERLSSTPGTTYYYLGENENGEVQAQIPPTSRSKGEDHQGRKLSTRTTCVEEEGSAAPLRTPSPYYVRLRRDLITSYAPALCPPRNFGMDKEGQLLIDYSQNWLGLEKYMQELKLT